MSCFRLPAASPALPSYFTRIWQTEDELPHNAVTAVLQTRDGYLWIGTYDGLARFDGASFMVFDNSNTPEMHNSRVTSLFEDGDGNLWIGHETGELTRYRNGIFQAVEVNPAWDNRKIISIGADANGKVWLLNDDGKLADINNNIISAPDIDPSARPATYARNRYGIFWLVFDGKLFELKNGEMVQLLLNRPSAEDFVTAVCPSRDGGVWIASNGDIRKWDGHDWIDDAGAIPWGQSPITTAVETKSGCLAFGTLDNGLYLVFPHRGTLHFNRDNGLPHDWVRTLFEDREGTLWVGTGSGGLVALRAGEVATVNPPDHWQGRVVLSVDAARDGALWVGTEGAGLYRLLNGEWTHFGENNGLSNLFVWSVSEDKLGREWVGTWGGGLYIRHGDRLEIPPGLEGLTVPMTALLHGQSNVTWVGTGSGLLRYELGATTWYGRREGLTLPDVRAVLQDTNGDVWFGMLGGGLGHLHNGKVRQFRKTDGLSNDYVQCLHLDGDGGLWFGTYGGGLNRFKDGRFANVGTAQGLPNNFICDIEEDEHGYFWLSSHGGIFRVELKSLNRCADGKLKTVSCLVYGKGDGMPTLECSGGLQPAGCKTADGRLWFPTSKGLVALDPNDAKANQLIPPVLIEKFLVDGQLMPKTADGGVPLQIPPGRQRFEFHYTGLSFVAPEKVRFQYRLEGLEPDWLDAGTKRTVAYGYIPPGNYTFRVIACNSDGRWNDIGASLAFTVQPHFWQVLWFRIIAGLAGAGLFGGTILFFARRRMRRKLERLERQRAVERERARIAQDIHDNLGASLTRITLLSQQADGSTDNLQHATTQLDRIYNTARELTRAMDEIVWAVNPQHDTLDSLASYLGKFAQDYLVPLNIRCRLDMPVQLPAWPLTAEVRHNLFLSFKEALNNVVKHAAASEVYISLIIKDNAFSLIVRDNGRGFTLDTRTQSGAGEPSRFVHCNGLLNMRRRLEKIGGRCEIESEPERGTEVKFIVTTHAHSS